MPDSDSVGRWIKEVREGSSDAESALWERYFPKLINLARVNLVSNRRDRATDEEDVALSVLDSFFAAARQGRFPDLKDRDGLWRLLSKMTYRKVVDYVRTGSRQRRGNGNVMGESAFGDADSVRGIELVEDHDLTPDFVVVVAEQCQHLLDQLDDQLRKIAMKKLEGFTNKEISGQLGCAVATVERRLQLIRHIWQREQLS